MNLGGRRGRRREGKKAIGLEVFARDEGARGENWKFGVSQPSISASRFTLSYRTSPFDRDLANNNACLVAQNPRNSTLVAAKCLDWRGTIQSRATRYWFKQSSSSPSPPRKSGLNCCNFFIGEVVKCFMGERAKLAAAAAAAVLLDDHELLKLPGTVRCFRELMEGIRRGMERYDYYTFSIPDIVVCQTSRHVLHTNFSNRRFFFYFFLTLRTMHFSRIFSVRKLVFMEDDISSEVRCKFCKIGVFFPNIRGGGGLLL